MKKRYYIAYGSNLNFWQMGLRCPGSRVVGTSTLEGYELLFRGSKSGHYLTIEKKAGGRVPVAIWEVTSSDEARLDRYEGYPNFYYKAELELPVTWVRSGKVKNLSCFVYIMHEDRPLGIPSPEYMDACLEGYEHFGFDKRALYDAVLRSWGADDEE